MICEIICVAGFLCMSSGHCSHLICICTCHLHEHMRIMHILSAVVLHMFDNANVIYMSSLLLFIDPYMLYTHIHIICYVSFTFI